VLTMVTVGKPITMSGHKRTWQDWRDRGIGARGGLRPKGSRVMGAGNGKQIDITDV
jgi:hypothetical protein